MSEELFRSKFKLHQPVKTVNMTGVGTIELINPFEDNFTDCHVTFSSIDTNFTSASVTIQINSTYDDEQSWAVFKENPFTGAFFFSENITRPFRRMRLVHAVSGGGVTGSFRLVVLLRLT